VRFKVLKKHPSMFGYPSVEKGRAASLKLQQIGSAAASAMPPYQF